jgi:hypothetical protein
MKKITLIAVSFAAGLSVGVGVGAVCFASQPTRLETNPTDQAKHSAETNLQKKLDAATSEQRRLANKLSEIESAHAKIIKDLQTKIDFQSDAKQISQQTKPAARINLTRPDRLDQLEWINALNFKSGAVGVLGAESGQWIVRVKTVLDRNTAIITTGSNGYQLTLLAQNFDTSDSVDDSPVRRLNIKWVVVGKETVGGTTMWVVEPY